MRGEDAADFSTTYRTGSIPTCVGLMRMNLAALPCSTQPGAGVFPNFGDTALNPDLVDVERAAPIPGAVPCLGGIDHRGSMP